MRFSAYGMTSEAASGTASTYYCDGLWFNDSATTYAYRGGDCYDGAVVGAFSSILHNSAGNASWGIGASVSCKPLVA